MAFLKRANAMVVHPRISSRGWGGIRKVASSGSSRNLTDQAHEILGTNLNSDTHLVTHCTIVASVDVDDVVGVKLGNVKVGSKIVNRKWADYHIKPQCSQFVNNNGDSWSRDVLRMAYPTFIGAHNFREHVQIEDQSKGRIIDAAARDIGDSLYIDILVATDRKHAALVQDIEAGKMATLSMGCTTDFSLCSQCGHFAVDETQLCDHIKYAKLNTFMDDAGQKRVIAELCGHQTYDENPDAPGGVRFIEASWVAVPAFPGAVMRNILAPGEVSGDQVRKVLASPPPQWSDSAIAKAANLSVPSQTYTRSAFGFDEGDDEGGDESAAPDAPAAPFQDVEDAIYENLKTRVHERIKKELAQKNIEEAIEPDSAMGPNDNLNKEASLRYATAINTLVRVASSPIALVEGAARINASYGISVSRGLYRVALTAGIPTNHSSIDRYLFACRKAAGRDLNSAEVRVVVRVGTLLAQWASINNPPT
jgi:hypothetical protein